MTIHVIWGSRLGWRHLEGLHKTSLLLVRETMICMGGMSHSTGLDDLDISPASMTIFKLMLRANLCFTALCLLLARSRFGALVS